MESYSDTLRVIMATATKPNAVNMPSLEAIGHVLAEDLVAPITVPPFNNSAMDGVAFIAADVANASTDAPVRLPLTEIIAAGAGAVPETLVSGTAVEIMTGAPVPEGADTVMPVENIVRDGDSLLLTEPYPTMKHVRLAGEDMRAGDVVIKAGTRLDERHILAITSLGVARLSVYPRTAAVWLSTGPELVDDLDEPLVANQIYNSSGRYGSHMLSHIGADFMWQKTVGDDGDSFTVALHEALNAGAEVVLSTGAVSAGKYDFVRDELEKMGAEIIVHKARVRPGKPVLFAVLPGGQFFFGLPGNPVSSAVSLRVFAAPFIAALNGDAPEAPINARMAGESSGPKHLTIFKKARFSVTPSGQLEVSELMGQESFKVAPMVEQNCWLVHTEGTDTLNEGDMATILPFFPNRFE